MTNQSQFWEILVPTEMEVLTPTGLAVRPVKVKHHRVWDKFVRELTGGLTLFKPVKGQWVCPQSKELFAERMIPVRIACSEDQIRKIIQYSIKHYNQRAILAYKVSEQVIIEYRK